MKKNKSNGWKEFWDSLPLSGDWAARLSRYSSEELEQIESKVYDYYKHLPLWTLDDGVILLYRPLYLSEVRISCCDNMSAGFLVDIPFIDGSIETGKLKVIGYDREKVRNIKYKEGDLPFEREVQLWEECPPIQGKMLLGKKL